MAGWARRGGWLCACVSLSSSIARAPKTVASPLNSPIQTVFEPLAFYRARLHDCPLPAFERVQPERLADLCFAHCVRLILLVGKDKQLAVLKLVFGEES